MCVPRGGIIPSRQIVSVNYLMQEESYPLKKGSHVEIRRNRHAFKAWLSGLMTKNNEKGVYLLCKMVSSLSIMNKVLTLKKVRRTIQDFMTHL
nr:MAG TPA: hypothetical protein [Caudoviricetes sp.]